MEKKTLLPMSRFFRKSDDQTHKMDKNGQSKETAEVEDTENLMVGQSDYRMRASKIKTGLMGTELLV